MFRPRGARTAQHLFRTVASRCARSRARIIIARKARFLWRFRVELCPPHVRLLRDDPDRIFVFTNRTRMLSTSCACQVDGAFAKNQNRGRALSGRACAERVIFRQGCCCRPRLRWHLWHLRTLCAASDALWATDTILRISRQPSGDAVSCCGAREYRQRRSAGVRGRWSAPGEGRLSCLSTQTRPSALDADGDVQRRGVRRARQRSTCAVLHQPDLAGKQLQSEVDQPGGRAGRRPVHAAAPRRNTG